MPKGDDKFTIQAQHYENAVVQEFLDRMDLIDKAIQEIEKKIDLSGKTPNGRAYVAFSTAEMQMARKTLLYAKGCSLRHEHFNRLLDTERKGAPPWGIFARRAWERDHPNSKRQ